MSVVDPALANPIRPAFAIPGEAIKAGGTPEPGAVVPQEPAGSRAVIAALKMIKHTEVRCMHFCLKFLFSSWGGLDVFSFVPWG